MTNEEAKKMLKAKLDCLIRETSGTDIDCNYRNCDECNLCYAQGDMGEQKEALELAIKALEQEPCEDCISRQEAVRVLANRRDELIWLHTVNPEDNPKVDARAYGVNWSLNTLMELPSVTPQPKTGEWIDIQYYQLADTYYRPKCPFCNAEPKEYSNYCPKCGAKLLEEDPDY